MQLAARENALTPAAGLAENVRQRAQRPHTPVADFVKLLQATAKKLKREKEQVWRDKDLLTQVIYLYVENKGLFRRGKNGIRVLPMPERSDSPVYSFGVTGFYADNIKAKWTNSNTDVKFRPARDVEDAIGAADGYDTVHEHYRRRIYDAYFKQRESTFALCGRYTRYFYYSDEAKGYERRPRIGQQELQLSEGAYYCADCGNAGSLGELGGMPGVGPDLGGGGLAGEQPRGPEPVGEMGDGDAAGASAESHAAVNAPVAGDVGLPDSGGQGTSPETAAEMACPQCGSPNLDVEPPASVPVETVEGYDEVETGDITGEVISPFELRHEIDKLPQESDWLCRTRRVRASVLQEKFPALTVKASRGENPGLDRQRELQESGYFGAGTTFASRFAGKDDDEFVDFEQWWLAPCLYADWQLESPVETLEGQTIPAGAPLSEIYPDGLYFCVIAGVDGIVEVANESHKEHFVGGVYRMTPSNALGSGIEDMVEGNRQFNLVYSMIYEQLRSGAWPATLYEESLFPNGLAAYIGRGNKNLPVKTIGLPEGRTLNDSVKQLMPQPPSAQHFQYAQKLDEYTQKASRVTDFSGGLPGVNNETATGAQIAAANSQSLFAPMLELKAEVDRQSAAVLVKLFQKHCGFERFVSLAGKRGAADGMWMDAANLDADVQCEVVPESYLPNTNLDRRQKLEAFLLAIGGFPNVKLAQEENPGLFEYMVSAYDIDLGAQDYKAAAKLASQRIDQMKRALPALQVHLQTMPPVQMAVDPMTGVAGLQPVDIEAEAGAMLLGALAYPVEVEELGHLAGLNFGRDWLTTDEGLNAPPLHRIGVKALIADYATKAVQAALLENIGIAATQPPMMGPEPPPGEGPPPSGKSPNKNPDAKQVSGNRPSPKPQKQSAGANA